MAEKTPAVVADAPAAEKATRKAAKADKAAKPTTKTGKTAHRGRPPLAPEVYVEYSGKQYNITDLVDRAKADYRLTHKVGVQSCKVYIKPEEEAAYYVVNKVSGKLPLYPTVPHPFPQLRWLHCESKAAPERFERSPVPLLFCPIISRTAQYTSGSGNRGSNAGQIRRTHSSR